MNSNFLSNFSAKLVKKLNKKTEFNEISIHLINEENTTLKAEKLYRKTNYNWCLQLISKIISWRPSRPVDDYAAIVIGRKFLQQNN